MKIDVNLVGVDGVLATLKALPAEVASKRGGPVKKALAKGARMLRDKARANLRAAIAQGPTTRSTGELEKRIIASRGKEPTGTKGERYLVRVRRKDYLNADGERTNPLMTANLLEYGSSHQPATPWLRPALQSQGEVIIKAVTAQLVADIDKAVKSLAKLSRK